MKYLCLGYQDDKMWNSLPEGERNAVMVECLAYVEVLRKNGHCLDLQCLQPPGKAATLRMDGGKVLVTDGPFAETKEQLGGIMVLEASDLNHAIQLMSRHPCWRLGGSMEIRALQEDTNQAVASRHGESK